MLIIRDCHIGTLVIAEVSTQKKMVEVILWVMTKVPCYKQFITYSKTNQIFFIKIQKNIDFHSEIEELRHKIRITSFEPRS